MQNIIEAKNISKLYKLGVVSTGTLSHDLNRWWHKARGKEDPYTLVAESNNRESKGESDYVWSLRDISFDIKAGEIVGIIGKNGAGKSTLLKILSRVTGPTSGSVKLRGRVASLLEVGTGFHPELTGRENLYLNGTILGMTKKEIDRKFDEIVAFSGVERYIDTPVKRYSSGMYVRLAFAVAAHLDPEILIVDEVLAVGDAEFQKKCLGKMKQVSEGEGRTVLFVSHNMSAVKTLCTSAILLQNGRLINQSDNHSIVAQYLASASNASSAVSFEENNAPGTNLAKLLSVKIFNEQGHPEIEQGDGFSIEAEVLVHTQMQGDISITFHLRDELDHLIFVANPSFEKMVFESDGTKTKIRFRCSVAANIMNEGHYRLARVIILNSINVIANVDDVIFFNIVPSRIKNISWQGQKEGIVAPKFNWQIEQIN